MPAQGAAKEIKAALDSCETSVGQRGLRHAIRDSLQD
jgi:hypothetical protein